MKKAITLLIIFIILIISGFLFIDCVNTKNYMIDLSNYSINDIKEYALKNNLNLIFKEEYSLDIEKDHLINQNIKQGKQINKNDNLEITISLGIDKSPYIKYNVNELGNVPVMMYHGIKNMKNEDTNYIGGNVDINGYQRTSEAFINDLEFYYNEGYRMIRLIDYVEGNIDVALGYSPIVLTFDDGLNNIKVTGLDENGNIIIDPNSAIGILESFKKKYPDYNVTATFFINSTLFYNSTYNKKIIEFLISNGYDIGNHSYNHLNINKLSKEETMKEIGRMYQILDDLIPNEYVNIVALPYGNPSKSHDNFSYVLNGQYNNYEYKTISTLRVAWEANCSPFDKNFDKTYIKRIRAYDNNGTNFDIKYNFNLLNNNRYISDGDKNHVVVREKDINSLVTSKKIISY